MVSWGFMQDEGPMGPRTHGPMGPRVRGHMGPWALEPNWAHGPNGALYLGPGPFIWPIILTGQDDYMAMSG